MAPPPREVDWYDLNQEPLDGTKLNHFKAIRGWIYNVSEQRDSEGPDYKIDIAYELEGELKTYQLKVGYDGYNWGVSYPDHYNWFINKMKPGNAITLLIDSKNKVSVFGQYEVFILERGVLTWVAN